MVTQQAGDRLTESACRRVLVVFACLFPLLLAGCGGTPAAPTPTPEPALPPAPTATPAVVPSATLPPTRTPPPTVAPPPTLTPTPAGPPQSASLGDSWVRPADGAVMVYVPAGVFWMGSDDTPYTEERPAHEVSVDAFWIDQTEVTVAQYVRCVDAGACKPPVLPGSFARETYYGESAYGQYPVVHVNWYRAVSYCSWAGGRLPAEAEWAYAARGPESRHYPWGDVPDATRLNYCDVNCDLSHADPAGDDGYADTAPVGSYPAGASWVGAFDLLGNAWEWVWDWFDYYPSPERPGWMAPAMTHRVIRGGGWDTVPDHARNAYRGWYDPAAAQDSIGFRCAVSVAGE